MMEAEEGLMRLGIVAALAAEARILSPGVVPMQTCLLYTSPSPRDRTRPRMPSSA